MSGKFLKHCVVVVVVDACGSSTTAPVLVRVGKKGELRASACAGGGQACCASMSDGPSKKPTSGALLGALPLRELKDADSQHRSWDGGRGTRRGGYRGRAERETETKDSQRVGMDRKEGGRRH